VVSCQLFYYEFCVFSFWQINDDDDQLEHFVDRPSADILCGRPSGLLSFELKIGTPATPALGNVYTNFVFFSGRFVFRYDPVCDRQTDGRTDG